MNWFQRHLNWSLVLVNIAALSASIWVSLFSYEFTYPTFLFVGRAVACAILIPFTVWFLRRKGRSLGWVWMLFVPLGEIVLLCLRNHLTHNKKIKDVKKRCPYCGQSLHDAALKCSRCKEWVPNELFNRLSDEDVKLIKNGNLTPSTPSLVAYMVIGLLKDSNLKKQVEKQLIRGLNRKQSFNLLVFESYCCFTAICLSAKIKRGCRDTIMADLKVKLLNGIIESSGVKMLGTEDEESTRILRVEGEVLYNKFEDIWKDLGTDTPSQVRNTTALASAVYGDKQGDMFNGLPLYAEFISTPFHMQEGFKDTFLVEENDFDWQAITGFSL